MSFRYIRIKINTEFVICTHTIDIMSFPPFLAGELGLGTEFVLCGDVLVPNESTFRVEGT
jgi:hypothetical protein